MEFTTVSSFVESPTSERQDGPVSIYVASMTSKKGAEIMSRLSILLSAALILSVVTGALPAQAPQRPQGGQGQQAAALPDGASKELVARACTTCHAINQITNSTGYTKERWQSLFATMIKLPDPQPESVAQYLAAHFPSEAAA
jgi:hypothetical protein